MENCLKETFINVRKESLKDAYIPKIIRNNFIIEIDEYNAKIVIVKRKN